jgi:hypothetical protein
MATVLLCRQFWMINNPVEHIYCLSDFVAIGHETNQVFELLFSRDDITFVLRNRDEAILNILS